MKQSPLQKALQKLREKSWSTSLAEGKVIILEDAERILQEMEVEMLKEFEERKNKKEHY